ncbi:hypothetical protein [Amycolatopsis orientalis]|uniref:hypothetical protein n=1 Tax=Amycolatopsis orientalis TaxID=31958 RepID=UPI000561C140|nr:hypothetical protein [Amycolatopsis orientalis]
MDAAAYRRRFLAAPAAASEAVLEMFTSWCASVGSCEIHRQDAVAALCRVQVSVGSGGYCGRK